MLVFMFFSFMAGNDLFTAEKIKVSGKVMDADDGGFLEGASVFISGLNLGTITNDRGRFSLTVPAGEHLLIVSYVGYKTDTTAIDPDDSTFVWVRLHPTALQTDEIRVVAEKDKNIAGTTTGMVKLNSKDINRLPSFLGERDPMKILQLTPGIQSAKEGATGFYVRGGGPDQNLVLYDGAVLYNPSHLFGFFSIFNSDAIERIIFYKAGTPAQYGGRLSSVIELSSKKPPDDSIRIGGGIGLLASRLSAGGPFHGNKGKFMIAGRRTYLDILAKPFRNRFKDNSDFSTLTAYHFYDVNAKLEYRINPSDRLMLSIYYGDDAYDYGKAYTQFSTDIQWGNRAAVLKWNHIENEKLSLDNSLVYSGYDFDFFAQQSTYGFSLNSSIADYAYRTEVLYLPDNHKINLGLEYTYHHFDPNRQKGYTEDAEFYFSNIENLFSHELAVYLNDEYSINQFVAVNMGLRYSFFAHLGPYQKQLKDAFGHITDTINYGRFEPLHQGYHRFEPRISSRFRLNSSASIKLSFNRGYQYVHIAPISTISLPTDLWIPSTYKVPPQYGNQYAAGYYHNFLDDDLEASVEVYYKTLDNQISFNSGVIDNLNKDLQERLIFGQGTSYGAELFFRKKYGKWTGWVGYTLAYTTRRFDEIENGNPFFAKYDRRHDLSLVASYQFNPAWEFSGILVYASGNAMTIPTARYLVQGNVINEYGPVNAFRMPPYHRMDVSATYYPGGKSNRRSGYWNFSLYNVYNRSNPYFIYFEADRGNREYEVDIKPEMVTLFPILPSVSYNFVF